MLQQECIFSFKFIFNFVTVPFNPVHFMEHQPDVKPYGHKQPPQSEQEVVSDLCDMIWLLTCHGVYCLYRKANILQLNAKEMCSCSYNQSDSKMYCANQDAFESEGMSH